jgi:hypothetical protein
MIYKIRLKIPKECPEAVNRKRTDSAMAKRKREKRTNNDIHSKDRATKAPMKSGSELRYSERKAVPVPHVAPVVLLTYCRRGYW